MAIINDSLVVNGVIELLGGGVPSQHPGCVGAIFRLGRDFDLSGAPAPSTEKVASLLAGEQTISLHATNRLPRLPVSIIVPTTGDYQADRLTLAAARELLLQTATQPRWQLVWTRDGGLPLTYDCQGIGGITINHSLLYMRNLCSLVEINFEALPHGRSDTAETIVFPAPSQIWGQPPAAVTLDAMTAASNFLVGNTSTFEGTTGSWVGGTNCSVAYSTLQAHAGTGSMRMRSGAAGTMFAASMSASTIYDQDTGPGTGLRVQPGDTVNVRGWFRAATAGRTCNIGADFYDANGVFISTLYGANISDLTTGWTQATATLTTPVGAAWARVDAQVVSTAAANEDHYLDDAWIDKGNVYSADTPSSWSFSTVTAVTSQNSAKWNRVSADSPVYDHTLPAPLDITGRDKLTFWLGLATTSTGFGTWHRGRATVAVTLYDSAGGLVTFGAKQVRVVASALDSKPRWQLMSMHIPQSIPTFNYTSVARYVINVWNAVDGKTHSTMLQASAYLCSVTASPNATGSPVTRGSFYTLPGIVGTARAPVGIQLAPGLSSFSSTASFSTVGSNNWTCPGGVTSLDKVECWAGGGGGAGGNSNDWVPGGGGGGGEYSMSRNVPVTPTTVYHPIVGAAGVKDTSGGAGSNNATAGGDSYFVGDSSNTTYAHGGGRGSKHPPPGFVQGRGGSGSTNYLHFTGGDGWAGNAYDVNDGGGGGGSAGTGSDGNDAVSRLGAAAVPGGGSGGKGGGGVAGQRTGADGTFPGGGGGGGGANQTGGSPGVGDGGNGVKGQIILTWGASGLSPLASSLVHMPGVNAPPQLNPICGVGNGADTPNGATDYTVPAVGTLAARFDGSYSIYLIASSFNTPANSRTVTVTAKQFAYSGGGSITASLVRTFTPSTDIFNGYVEMGVLTLPLGEIAPGNTDSYFAVSVTDTNTADRFYDVLFLDTQGQTALLNTNVAAFANNIWLDPPDLDRDLGGIFGSDTDRDRARSLLPFCDPSSTRISGGPLTVEPNGHNRMLVYATQGNPALTLSYFPRWWEERLS